MKFDSTITKTKKNQIHDLMLEAIELQSDGDKRNGSKIPHSSTLPTSQMTKTGEAHDDRKRDHDCTLKDENTSDDKEITGRVRSCTLRLIIFLAISGALFGTLFATGVLRNEDIAGIPLFGDIDFEGFFDSDPYGGLVTPETPETAYRWQIPQQTGLELTILNALTDDWQPEFELAIAQWDTGEPDTLTLQTQRVKLDSACEPVNGVLKVCNGNYGATDWRGLNTVLLDLEEKWIYASTAQMNEYYLSHASAAHRQYTMCHELGHGFGLPHWDVKFNNANMGNCMDYTSRPKTNQQPDAANFNFLKELYGVVGGAASNSTLQPAVETSPPQSEGITDDNNNNNEAIEDQEGNERRFLFGPYSRSWPEKDKRVLKDIPENVMSAYRFILQSETLPHERRHLLRLEAGKATGDTKLIHLGYEHFAVLIHQLGPLDDRDMNV